MRKVGEIFRDSFLGGKKAARKSWGTGPGRYLSNKSWGLCRSEIAHQLWGQKRKKKKEKKVFTFGLILDHSDL